MRRAFAVLLVGCAKSAPPPELPSNRAAPTANVAPATPAPRPMVSLAGELLPPGPAGTCSVGGFVIDDNSLQTLGGATVVISTGDDHEPLITDDNGNFLVHRAMLPDAIRTYYLEAQGQSHFSPAWCGQRLRLEITLPTVP